MQDTNVILAANPTMVPNPEDYPEDIPKSIKGELVQLDGQKARLAKWIDAAENAELVVAELVDQFKAAQLGAEEAGVENRFWLKARPSVTIGVQTGSLQGVLIFLYIRNDVRDAVPLLREVRKRFGWKKPENSVKGYEEYAEIRRRSYILEAPDGTPVKICLMLPSEKDGAKCKYVEVGKKESPIYELQCEDADGKLVPVPAVEEGDAT